MAEARRFISWIYEPYASSRMGFVKGMVLYAINPQYRISARIHHVAKSRGLKGKWLEARLMTKHSVVFSPDVTLGNGVRFMHPVGLVIGSGSIIGDNVKIYQGVTIGQNRGGYPVIKDGVIIYANAVLVGSITIGEGAVIGAGSVVVKDVPPRAIVGGIPARIIRYRDANSDAGYY